MAQPMNNDYSGNFDTWLGSKAPEFQDQFNSDMGGNFISQYKALDRARQDYTQYLPGMEEYNNVFSRGQGRPIDDPYQFNPEEISVLQTNDPTQKWLSSLSPEMRNQWNRTSNQYHEMKRNTPVQKGISFLGKMAQGIPLAVAGAGVLGALGGGGLSSMFGGGAELGAGAEAGLGYGGYGGAGGTIAEQGALIGADAVNPMYGASKLPYRPFDVLGVGQSMGGVAAPAVEGTMSASAAAGGGASGIQDYFKGLIDNVKEKPLSSLIGGARTLSSLGGLWSSYQQNQDYGNLAGNLMSMYGDDSAYARQLRKELQRRDAASGRRSQYGPRAVELQARLAELNSRNAGTLANIYQQQGVNRDNMVKSGLNIGKSTGLLDWLDGQMKAPLATLFGG